MTAAPRRPPTRIPWWRSIRARIALAVTLVSMVVSTAVGLILAHQSALADREALRSEALGRLTVASDGYALDGRLRFGAALDPKDAPAELRDQLSDTRTTRQVTLFDGSTMWAAGRLGPDVVLVVALDGSRLVDQDEARITAVSWAVNIAVLVSAILGWVAGTTLSRRLRRAAVAADEIAAGSTHAQAAQGGSDEVARLTSAVDDMAGALQARLVAERDFTADVAHELRTPLTGLVSASELLPEGEATDLVRAQVLRLRRLVEDLLEVSRLDRDVVAADLAEVDLGDAVRQSLVRLAGQTGDLDLDVEIGATERVSVDERRLDRVLGNLLANLARHGGGRGRLTAAGTSLELTDSGPGYPADVLEHGPRRFHATGASKGSGLGMTIAIKQAQSMGARVELGTAEPGGALTRVHLRPAPRADQAGGVVSG